MTYRPTSVSLWALIALIALIALTGCGSVNAHQHTGSLTMPVGATIAVTTDAAASFAAPLTAAAPRVSTAASATAPTVTQPATGGLVINAVGAILPDRVRTPGAINPAVNQADIRSTICVSGWTATIRPPSSYTTSLKEQQLAGGYAYHGDLRTGDYEEDHLISLELGGSPSSALNLWPEPYNAPDGARTKDVIENRLHELVCAGTLSLATAQHAIASNWFAAYRTYLGSPAPVASVPAAYSAPRPAPVVSAPAAHPAGATGRCNDGTYSYALHHQGMCSKHGGVAQFYN